MNNPTSILLVDDDKDMTKAMERGLTRIHSRWKFEKKINSEWIFQRACSIQEALGYIAAHRFDAVITDWKLNEQDRGETGVRVITEALTRHPFCVTILISGHTVEFDRYAEVYADGTFDYIPKTKQGAILLKELSFRLRNALRRQDAHLRADAYARHIDHNLREKYTRASAASVLHKRWMTIMFTDIRSFSAVSGRLKAHQTIVSDFLTEMYGIIIESVHEYGGIVDKFMGDGSLSLFGALTNTSANGAAQSIAAVSAALGIQERCAPLFDKFCKTAQATVSMPRPKLSIGIGINRAEELVGIIQTPRRDQFTALGDGVNLAQRLESIAGKRKPGGKGEFGNILITSPVQFHAADNFQLKEEGELENLRNINEPHPVWSVLGPKNKP
jgi:class 3 adenylate cyclase